MCFARWIITYSTCFNNNNNNSYIALYPVKIYKLAASVLNYRQISHALSPFLIGRTVSSPNILRTVRWTIVRFLIAFRRTFSSPNMIRTVRQTILRFLTGLYNEMQASAWTCGRSATDSMIQNVGWSRVKSSQYTLISPHRVIQLTTISFWVPEKRLSIPQIKK